MFGSRIQTLVQGEDCQYHYNLGLWKIEKDDICPNRLYMSDSGSHKINLFLVSRVLIQFCSHASKDPFSPGPPGKSTKSLHVDADGSLTKHIGLPLLVLIQLPHPLESMKSLHSHP